LRMTAHLAWPLAVRTVCYAAVSRACRMISFFATADQSHEFLRMNVVAV